MAGHQEEDLANGVVEPKPAGGQWGLEDVEGRGLEEVGPVEGVVDLEGDNNQEEAGLGEEVPAEAGQTDQGREQGEEVCRHDLEDPAEEAAGPGQGVQVDLEGQGVQVDLEEGVEDPESHLKEQKQNKTES